MSVVRLFGPVCDEVIWPHPWTEQQISYQSIWSLVVLSSRHAQQSYSHDNRSKSPVAFHSFGSSRFVGLYHMQSSTAVAAAPDARWLNRMEDRRWTSGARVVKRNGARRCEADPDRRNVRAT